MKSVKTEKTVTETLLQTSLTSKKKLSKDEVSFLKTSLDRYTAQLKKLTKNH